MEDFVLIRILHWFTYKINGSYLLKFHMDRSINVDTFIDQQLLNSIKLHLSLTISMFNANISVILSSYFVKLQRDLINVLNMNWNAW